MENSEVRAHRPAARRLRTRQHTYHLRFSHQEPEDVGMDKKDRDIENRHTRAQVGKRIDEQQGMQSKPASGCADNHKNSGWSNKCTLTTWFMREIHVVACLKRDLIWSLVYQDAHAIALSSCLSKAPWNQVRGQTDGHR